MPLLESGFVLFLLVGDSGERAFSPSLCWRADSCCSCLLVNLESVLSLYASAGERIRVLLSRGDFGARVFSPCLCGSVASCFFVPLCLWSACFLSMPLLESGFVFFCPVVDFRARAFSPCLCWRADLCCSCLLVTLESVLSLYASAGERIRVLLS